MAVTSFGMEKVIMIFGIVLDQSISWEQFQELSEALDRMFMADFPVVELMRYGSPHMEGVRACGIH